MKTTLALLTSLLLALPAASSELEKQFANPPLDCSPGIFWYWLSGFVTEAGIDADLEAMKQAGIGNVMLFNIQYISINPNPVMKPLEILGPEWRRLMKHALKKADSLGMKLTLNNSMGGWSSTGGPSITPELGMQRVTWNEMKIEGGQRFTGKMPQPKFNLNTYHDIAVIAFPTPETEAQPDPIPVVTSDVPGFDPAKLSSPVVPSIGFGNYSTDFQQSRADTAMLKEVAEKNADVKWIWFPEKDTQAGSAVNAPVCTRYFRRSFTVDDASKVKQAELLITADNACKVWLNGEEVTEAASGNWQIVRACDIAKRLKSGNNVLAVEAENQQGAGPAGLLATVSLITTDGTTTRIVSDGQWKSSDTAADAWRDPSFSEDGWKPALETVAHGQAPWGPVLGIARRHIMLTYDKPYAAQALRLYPAYHTPWLDGVLATGEIQQSQDGMTWQTIRPFTLRGYTPLDITFPAPPARFWRIALSGEKDLPLDELKLRDDYRLHNWTSKALFSFHHLMEVSGLDMASHPAPASAVIQKEKIIDISSRMNAAGDLDWEVPAGNWTVMRFGYTPIGTDTAANSGAHGLENDKLNRASLDAHWNHSIRPWLDDPETKPLFDTLHIDSYEAGTQNWTGAMPEEFLKRNGYDIATYLPVVVGRVIDSNLHSERFLWDFRRTITDLMTENYYGYFKELCEGAGKKFSIEPYGGGSINNVAAASAADLPMAEHDDYFGTKLAASPAHLYGKPVVSVEAFTAAPAGGGNWGTAFWDIKKWGDNFLCGGVNHFNYHVYSSQPFADNVKPGLTLGDWGTHFNRGHTWWPEMPAFSDYFRRCSHLLRQGRFVGDVLFCYGEGSPKNMGFDTAHPNAEYALPKGYDSDVCDLHALLNRITVKDGMLVTPDGISYRLLVVPNESDAMTPGLVKRIGELVFAGATVMAPKPLRSPSLQGQPQTDADLATQAAAIWGDCDGIKSQSHAYGKGTIRWGRTLAQTLEDLKVPPAIESPVIQGAPISWRWIQRRLTDGDLFFIASPSDEETTATFSFRAAGTTPRWLDPVTGNTRMLPDFEKKDGRVSLKLQIAPRQSGFVFFSDEPKTEPSTGGNLVEYKNLLTLEGPWNVSFDPKWGGPESTVFETLQDWSKHPDDGIKYYSGRATYTKSFTMTEVSPEQTYFLDLGSVKNLANVTLNNTALGTVWCAPWHVEIKPKAGENLLEITVVNLWVNRLIGDQKFDGSVAYDAGGHAHDFPAWLNGSAPRPKTRFTFSLYNPWKADSPLRESGLLGPVTVQTEDPITKNPAN